MNATTFIRPTGALAGWQVLAALVLYSLGCLSAPVGCMLVLLGAAMLEPAGRWLPSGRETWLVAALLAGTGRWLEQAVAPEMPLAVCGACWLWLVTSLLLRWADQSEAPVAGDVQSPVRVRTAPAGPVPALEAWRFGLALFLYSSGLVAAAFSDLGLLLILCGRCAEESPAEVEWRSFQPAAEHDPQKFLTRVFAFTGVFLAALIFLREFETGLTLMLGSIHIYQLMRRWLHAPRNLRLEPLP